MALLVDDGAADLDTLARLGFRTVGIATVVGTPTGGERLASELTAVPADIVPVVLAMFMEPPTATPSTQIRRGVAYPAEMRRQILDAVERGMPCTEAARSFGVSTSTVTRWVKQERADVLAERRQGVQRLPRRYG